MRKREDCFFGLHFDFHATGDHTQIGADFDEAQLDAFIKAVKPDFVQCDTKGHPGYASYPTKAGVHPPEMQRDILQAWRKITQENGVALYGHHSGVWDYAAVAEHPEWGVLNAAGENDPQATSIFGQYSEERLIPQLIELAKDYHLNGVWIDGDAWGVHPDYSPMAQRAWKEKSGSERVPLPGEPEWRAYLDLCRETFLSYVTNYVEKVKAVCPDFEIASNWINTEIAPVDDCITDFISGDLAATDCADSARFSGRLIADYHRPWDLMAWGFYSKSNYKSAEQLCQELAHVFSLGGSVQVYYKQSHRQVMLCENSVRDIASKVADFCRERKDCSKGIQLLPTVGVIYSAQAFYKNKNRVFADWEDMIYTKGVRGLMNCVLDNQIPTEVLRASTLCKRDLTEYKMLLLSDCPDMESDLPENLLTYAKQGGTLVLSGIQTLHAFSPYLRYTCQLTEDNEKTCIFADNRFAFSNEPELHLHGQLEQLERLQVLEKGKNSVLRDGTALYRMNWGKGSIYLIPFNFGYTYFSRPSYALRAFLRKIADAETLPLRGFGSQKVTISLGEKAGHHFIHLVNTNGESRSAFNECFEEITPIYDFNVEYCVDRQPVSVRNLPSGEDLPFTYEKGILKVRIPKIEIHRCLEVSFQTEQTNKEA